MAHNAYGARNCQAKKVLDRGPLIWEWDSVKFDLSPTQTEYVFSNATVNVLVGNTGEGKTHASVVAMPYHAARCGRPIRAAIVRDTHENIKTSTARSIQDVFIDDPGYIRFRNDFRQLTIKSDPPVEADLFGIDDLGSLSKLQGPEYALIWLEEPAPMADKVNAGLKEEVFNAALVRAARQRGTIPRVQVSMNPADEEHWTYKRFIEAPDVDPELPLITKRVWFIKYGENRYVSEESRQAVRAVTEGQARWRNCRYLLFIRKSHSLKSCRYAEDSFYSGLAWIISRGVMPRPGIPPGGPTVWPGLHGWRRRTTKTPVLPDRGASGPRRHPEAGGSVPLSLIYRPW